MSALIVRSSGIIASAKGYVRATTVFLKNRRKLTRNQRHRQADAFALLSFGAFQIAAASSRLRP
jgi:hypothetical protein